MIILHNINDIAFKAENTEDLKKQVIEHYSFLGYTPDVEIKDEMVIVTIDNDRIEQTQADFKKAIQLCNEGKLDKARDLLEKVIQVCPLHGDALRNLAQIKYLGKDLAGALKDCDSALKVNPKDTHAMILSGNIYRLQGLPQFAEVYYKGALRYEPDSVLVKNNLAAMAYTKGDFAEVMRLTDEAIASDSSYMNSYYLQAMTLGQQGKLRSAFDTGVEGLKKGSDRPENPGVRQALTTFVLQVAEKIAKETDWWDIIEPYKKRLEIEDGHDIDFVDDKTLSYNGRMEYRITHNAANNRMVYKSTAPFYEHCILHELTHLKMAIENTKADAGTIVSSPDNGEEIFIQRYGTGLRKVAASLSEKEQQNFMSDFYKRLGLRLMNAALDLFVEDYIFRSFPQARPLQMISLCAMEKENVNSDTIPMTKVLPPALVRVSRITNCVQSMQLKEMYGIDMVNLHQASKGDIDTAEDMYGDFKVANNINEVGAEYDLVTTFAEKLHMEDFIELSDEKVYTKKIYGVTRDELESRIREMQKEQQKEFAQKNDPSNNPVEGMMMTMYMLAALQYFDGMSKTQVAQIGKDIAILGLTGISPAKKSGYKVDSIPGKDFGGYELLAFYYVSWALAYPQLLSSLNLPYDEAYKGAIQMFEAKKK